MTTRTYQTAAAFKHALEQRLRLASSSGPDFARRRQLLVFDRFLARIIDVLGDTVMLKGGLVLELRLKHARTTKDIDLSFMGSPKDIFESLRVSAQRDLGDFMVFEIGPDDRHPEIRNDGMQYDGLRFHAQCNLAGKIYGHPFGVDIAFGEPILGKPQTVVAEDLLGFAGISPPRLRIYPVETHIAEKLHAYTMPRERENSRVKDLPDIALLARTGRVDPQRLRMALEQTFNFRKTHTLPQEVPDPPPAWATVYAQMAKQDDLPWATMPELTAAVRSFLNPVLQKTPDGPWSPELWGWEESLPED